MGDQSLESTQRSMKYLLALLAPALVAAEADTGYGYAPQVYCRDTNTSVYAQVCVPAFTTKVTPITLDVKRVVDNDYCYNQIRTVCEETNKVVPRKICTYKYNSVKEDHHQTTTIPPPYHHHTRPPPCHHTTPHHTTPHHTTP